MKQKITLLTRAAMLLLAVFFGFTGARAEISTFPWTEDFNSLTVDYSIPDGWDNSEGTTPESYRWSYTSKTNNAGYGGCNGTSHDGSNCVRFNSNVNLEGYTNFLKTIPLSLPTTPKMELTFWYRNPKGGDFSVYISTDGGTTHNTALVTRLTGATNWTKISPISLSAYAGQQVVIVFKGTSNFGDGDAFIYLDDVTVTPQSPTTWDELGVVLQTGGTVTLKQDIIRTGTDTNNFLEVPSGVTVTLDLNGHTINRALTAATAYGYVIKVSGTLTINDSSNPSTGSITGGWNNSGYGGGIYINNNTNARLTLNNGAITGNKVEKASGEAKGGCIYVGQNSIFTMNGGSITGNSVITSTQALGGGVYIHAYGSGYGTFNMNGGTITGNNITGATNSDYTVQGGGVYISNDSKIGKFNLSGNCTITGNTANSQGTEAENNVYVSDGTVIDIVGTLNTLTRIGVTASENQIITSGLNGKGGLNNFISDDSTLGLKLSNNEVKIVYPTYWEPVTTFPWTEDFNSLTVGGSIPDGWDNDDGTTTDDSHKWCYNSSSSGNGACNGTSYDGTKCVRFNSYLNDTGNTNFLKTIPLSLPATPDMELTFWYKNPAGGDFSVYISTDGGTTYETPLVTGLTGAAEWTEIEPIPLSAYAGQQVVIVFKGTSNEASNDAYIYLDDVTVEEVPACSVPTGLTATNITYNSADLSWTANSGETSWTLYYKKTADENYTTVPDVTANPYTLEGLEPNTSYVFYVAFLCSESGSEVASRKRSFTTLWAPVTTFPWTENFNSLTENNSIPAGWDNSEGTTTTNNFKWCYNNTSASGNGTCNGTSHDGTNCVRFDSYSNSNGNTNFLKTIPLILPATPRMELTFWYKNPTGGDFSVYISTDGGATHETALITGLTGATSWTYIEEPINLEDYAGQEVVIVFKGTSNWGNGDAHIYLDDVTVEEIPACSAPTGLTATNITPYSADLGWTANSGETSWTLYYKKAADENYTAVPDVTDNPYTLEGLEPNTSYDFYVAFLCSESGSEVTSKKRSFTTLWAAVTTFPWTENFNSLTENYSIPAGWDNSEGTTTENSYKWCYTTISTSGNGACNSTSHDGTNCVRFDSYNNSKNNTNFLKTIPLILPATPNMELTFWYKNPTGGDFSVYISTDGGVTYETPLVTGLTDVAEWTELEEPIPLGAYAGQQVVIVFKGTSNYANGDAYIYLDDVTVEEAPACSVPSSLTATNITPYSADLGWVANSGETSWTLYYKKTADENYTAVPDVTANPYTLEGLEPNTSYDFYVAFLCSESGSEVASRKNSFTTLWAPIATFPWTENFNSLTEDYSIPAGWDNSDGTTTNNNYKWCYTTSTTGIGACNSTSHDGTNCVRFDSYNNSKNNTNFLKTIPLILPATPNMELTFWYKNPTGGDFSVYISTDGGVTYETPLVTGLTDVAEWTELEEPIPLGAYAGQQVIIVFKGTSNFGTGNAHIYLDDVTVEEAPACSAPTSLTATNITQNSANLGWTANSGETSWTLYYKKAADEDYTPVTNVTSNPYTLIGLEPATTYDFYVAFLCSESGSEVASRKNSFTTLWAPVTITAASPYTQDFDYPVVTTTYNQVGEVPVGWGSSPENDVKGPKIIAKSTSYNYSSSQSLYFYGSGNCYAVVPEFTNPMSDLQISFKWATESKTNGTLTLGYITDGDDNYDTFTEIVSYPASNDSYRAMRQAGPINLKDLPAEAKRLVFRWYYSSWYACNVDDVEVSLNLIPLADNADNTDLIETYDGKSGYNVQLAGRTLWQDNAWNTLCLPFNVTVSDSPLAGADVRALTGASFANSTLTLNFSDENAVTELAAGTPYIIKWASGSNIVEPTFEGVTFDKTMNDVVCDLDNGTGITFKGTYGYTSFTEANKSILFMGGSNTLYYPGNGAEIGAQRAYFQLDGITAGTSTSLIKQFVLTFGDDATEIEDLNVDVNLNENIYNVAGQRLNKMQRGINIVNGKKILK